MKFVASCGSDIVDVDEKEERGEHTALRYTSVNWVSSGLETSVVESKRATREEVLDPAQHSAADAGLV